MSAMGVMETNRLYRKKPAHRMKDSGEIDVFEASRYFSGPPGTCTYTHNSSQRPMKEDTRSAVWGGRKSLDISFKNISFTSHSSTSHSSHMVNDKHMIQAENKKKKKSKLPSSPGGKLASFLNSLFSQASSKKKSKSCSQSVKDDQDHATSPNGRRRSSISHFHGFGSNRPSKSLYSFSSSGFRTPPPTSQLSNIEAYNKTRTMASLLESTKAAASTKEQRDQYYRDHDRDKSGHHAKIMEKKVNEREGDRRWVSEVSSQKSFRRAYDEKVEDGGDSDSSSDLFDLPNYALGGFYSNGLPVYETTHLQDINRSRAIS